MNSAILTNGDFSNASFYGTDLTNANLQGSNQPPPPPPFSNEPAKTTTNLINANLWGATLSGTNLTNVNLENANLYGVVAQPNPANFTGTLLYSANLSSTIMDGANFTDSFMHASSIQISSFNDVEHDQRISRLRGDHQLELHGGRTSPAPFSRTRSGSTRSARTESCRARSAAPNRSAGAAT